MNTIFGRIIREFEVQGKSREELARTLNINRKTLALHYRGERASQLQHVLDALLLATVRNYKLLPFFDAIFGRPAVRAMLKKLNYEIGKEEQRRKLLEDAEKE